MAHYFAWTDEIAERAKALWLNGSSASQIALAIGASSRNAVIGKLHRMGITQPRSATARAETARLSPQRRAALAGKAPPPRPPRTMAGAVLTTKLEQAATNAALQPSAAQANDDTMTATQNLGRFQCKWPIGDPLAPGFCYCEKNARSDKDNYCSEHELVAHPPRPANARRAHSGQELERMLRRYI